MRTLPPVPPGRRSRGGAHRPWRASVVTLGFLTAAAHGAPPPLLGHAASADPPGSPATVAVGPVAGDAMASLPHPDDPAGAAPAERPIFPAVRLGSTIFLSYQSGEEAGAAYSRFVVKRGYIDLAATLSGRLSARITPDVTQDASGETRLRLKYAYAGFSLPASGWITAPAIEFGMAHTPWLDFEEKIDRYRMQDTLFLERAGIMSSADLGVVAMGLLGAEMPEAYRRAVSDAYPGRWGSFAVGIYNGGGYRTSESNTNKVLEGRLSLRPLPDALPGLQVSVFAVDGRGNTAASPPWTLAMLTLTYQGRFVNAVGSRFDGKGNAAGTAVDARGRVLHGRGWSVFAEGRLSTAWSVIGRRDEATPDVRARRGTTRRTIAGVAYHLGGGNTVLLDREEVSPGGEAPPAGRTQLTLQLKF